MRHLLWIFLCSAALNAAEIVIENGRAPVGDRFTLTFEEDLRIGPGSGETYTLWSGASITPDADRQGNIFVTDPGGNRIVQFDANGKFVRQIGTQGEGPGEFQILSSFKVLDDGTAIAFDNLQVSVIFSHFDKAMAFVNSDKRSSFGMIIQSAIFSNNADKMASFYMIPNKDGVTIDTFTGFLSKDCKPLTTLTKTTLDRFDQTQLDSNIWWAGYLSKWFSMVANGIGVFAFAPNGDILTAVNSSYEITRWGPNLANKKMVIKRDYKPLPLDDAELMVLVEPIKEEILSMLPAVLHQYMTSDRIRKGLELAQMPPRKPPLYWVYPMEDGSLLAIHKYDVKSGRSEADIYDPAGKYIGVTTLPPIKVNFFGSVFGNNTKMVFKNGYAYAIEDVDAEANLVRYKTRLVPVK